MTTDLAVTEHYSDTNLVQCIFYSFESSLACSKSKHFHKNKQSDGRCRIVIADREPLTADKVLVTAG